MIKWHWILCGFVAFSSFLGAEECDEIAFEENECTDGQCQKRHYHLPEYNPEEEHLWQERSDSSWAGKRDDNLIDAFLHQ